MSQKSNKIIIDKALAFSLLYNLLKPFNKTDAFKLGLIDAKGNVIKKPETEDEQLALSIYNVVIFELKKILGNRISFLYKLLYCTQYNENDIIGKLVLSTTAVGQKTAVVRIEKTIEEMFMKSTTDKKSNSFINKSV